VKTVTGTLNDEKQCVDLYIPRKCVYTNKILDSRDRSSVQISIAQVILLSTFQVDEEGKYTGVKKEFCLSGFVRSKG